ncbi:MAG: hypothetical protein HYR68_01960 [Burkholderiales bacterium]|nr:hypothetical protein [Burkholderiales bacterium]
MIDLVDILRGSAVTGTKARRCIFYRHQPGLRGSAVTGTKARLWKFLWPVLAFGVGAVGGAFAYMYAGFFALGLPVVILCFVFFVGGGE